jgi:hypothetical protein
MGCPYKDLSSASSSPSSDIGIVWVAMLSTLFKNWSRLCYVKVELSCLTVSLIKKIVCSHPNHYPPQFTLGQVPAARANCPCHPHHLYQTTHQYHPSKEMQVSTKDSLLGSVLTTHIPCCKTYVIAPLSVDSGVSLSESMFYCSLVGVAELNLYLRVNLLPLDKIGASPPGMWSSLSMLAHVERRKLVATVAVV